MSEVFQGGPRKFREGSMGLMGSQARFMESQRSSGCGLWDAFKSIREFQESSKGPQGCFRGSHRHFREF